VIVRSFHPARLVIIWYAEWLSPLSGGLIVSEDLVQQREVQASKQCDHPVAEESVADAIIEKCAQAADYWGGGNWLYNANGRKRFTERDMQTLINTTGRAIAEDIRALKASSRTSGDRTVLAP
jgi:hypothetical protein